MFWNKWIVNTPPITMPKRVPMVNPSSAPSTPNPTLTKKYPVGSKMIVGVDLSKATGPNLNSPIKAHCWIEDMEMSTLVNTIMTIKYLISELPLSITPNEKKQTKIIEVMKLTTRFPVNPDINIDLSCDDMNFVTANGKAYVTNRPKIAINDSDNPKSPKPSTPSNRAIRNSYMYFTKATKKRDPIIAILAIERETDPSISF